MEWFEFIYDLIFYDQWWHKQSPNWVAEISPGITNSHFSRSVFSAIPPAWLSYFYKAYIVIVFYWLVYLFITRMQFQTGFIGLTGSCTAFKSVWSLPSFHFTIFIARGHFAAYLVWCLYKIMPSIYSDWNEKAHVDLLFASTSGLLLC